MQSEFPFSVTRRMRRSRARLFTLNGWLVLAVFAILSGLIIGAINWFFVVRA